MASRAGREAENTDADELIRCLLTLSYSRMRDGERDLPDGYKRQMNQQRIHHR